jgi:hypothetical protein
MGKKLMILALAAMLVGLVVPAYAVDLTADGPEENLQVGTVTANLDGGKVRVEYEITEPGWVITEWHLAVATDLGDIPQTGSGNPKVGKFELFDEDITPGVTGVTITYPDALSLPVFIAAHAVVYKEADLREETAWAGYNEGSPFPGRNWASYFIFDIGP